MNAKKLKQTGQDADDEREMRLLEEIERTPRVSQRDLSRRLSIALGVTNLLLRRLASRGYVRATRAGWRSWAYALTPSGMARKARLVNDYVRGVLGRYRSIRESLVRDLGEAGMDGAARVAIYCPGLSESSRDAAELVYLALKDCGVEAIDVVSANNGAGERLLGMPVRPLSTLNATYATDANPPLSRACPERREGNPTGAYDWVIVASLDGTAGAAEELEAAGVVLDRVLLPLAPGP